MSVKDIRRDRFGDMILLHNQTDGVRCQTPDISGEFHFTTLCTEGIVQVGSAHQNGSTWHPWKTIEARRSDLPHIGGGSLTQRNLWGRRIQPATMSTQTHALFRGKDPANLSDIHIAEDTQSVCRRCRVDDSVSPRYWHADVVSTATFVRRKESIGNSHGPACMCLCVSDFVL